MADPEAQGEEIVQDQQVVDEVQVVDKENVDAKDESKPDGTQDEDQVYTFEDAAPASDEEDPEGQDSTTFKSLRDQHRLTAKQNVELAKQLRERDEELARLKGATQKEQELGPKPKRGDPDIDFDDDKYEAALDAWIQRKAVHDQRIAERQQAEQEAAEQFKKKQERYTQGKTKVAVDDYDIAEASVMQVLSKDNRFAILLDQAKDPHHLVYALGKSPERLAELAKLPVPSFLVKIGELQMQLKPQQRKAPPPPAKRQSYQGANPAQSTQDKQLEKLRDEAAKTGDMTKLVAYKKSLRAA